MKMINTTHYPSSRSGFDLENWPLFSRGWAVQELLLSPRTLIFAKRELIWECIEQRTCQCESIGAYYTSEVDKRTFHDVRLGKFRGTHRGRTQHELEKLWRSCVMQYSPLAFTVLADKLPAIQGIADCMKAMRKDAQYLAGIWTDGAVMDLLWKMRTAGEMNECEEFMNQAPSWSWASVDAEVEYDQLYTGTGDNPTLYSEFVDGKVEFDGKITTGYVKLKCPMAKIPDCDASELTSQLLLKKLHAWYYPDRKNVGTGPCVAIRVAEFWDEHLLVLKLVDDKTQTYKRIGSAKLGKIQERIKWSESVVITII
jgi:hypothetical protein